MSVQKVEQGGEEVSLRRINPESVTGSFDDFKLMLDSEPGKRFRESPRMLHFHHFVLRAMEDQNGRIVFVQMRKRRELAVHPRSLLSRLAEDADIVVLGSIDGAVKINDAFDGAGFILVRFTRLQTVLGADESYKTSEMPPGRKADRADVVWVYVQGL